MEGSRSDHFFPLGNATVRNDQEICHCYTLPGEKLHVFIKYLDLSVLVNP